MRSSAARLLATRRASNGARPGGATSDEDQPQPAHDQERDRGEQQSAAPVRVGARVAEAVGQGLAGFLGHECPDGPHQEEPESRPSQRPAPPRHDHERQNRERRKGEEDDRHVNGEGVHG